MGHSASILCMILSAKVTASAMIECTAGDGLVLSKLAELVSASPISSIIESRCGFAKE